MSELRHSRSGADHLRWRLLATVSGFALIGVVSGQRDAQAADDSRKSATMWLELGGQFERVEDHQSPFVPPFMLLSPQPATYLQAPSIPTQRISTFSDGFEGKISFEPRESSWRFSASVRYGRSNGAKHVHAQTPFHLTTHLGNQVTPLDLQTADTKANIAESHSILDFHAGKDIGVGLFGAESKSEVAVGVRFAQFETKSAATVLARPTYSLVQPPPKYLPFIYHHSYAAVAHVSRSFRGIGPSLEWTASAVLTGNPEDGDLAVEWGSNVAVLFGRQKAVVQHATTGFFSSFHGHKTHGTLYKHSTSHERSRAIVVPNVGAFAGFSFNWTRARIGVGYRADIFFRAMDGGIDVGKDYTQNFYGPFATISLRLGG